MMPAFVIRTSRRPKRSIAASTSVRAPASVATSLVSAIASPPAATISSVTVAAGPASAPSPRIEPPRSLTTTRAPRSASRRAYARPMPRPAPVITATRPSKLCSSTRGPRVLYRPVNILLAPAADTGASSGSGTVDPTGRRAPTQPEVEGPARHDRRHLGAGVRAAGLPRHRDLGAVRRERRGQGRLLLLHRLQGGAARGDPRPRHGRGDGRRGPRRGCGRIPVGAAGVAG